MTPILRIAIPLTLALGSAATVAAPILKFSLDWSHRDGAFDGSAAEIVAHDPGSNQVYVVNGAKDRIDVLSDSDGTYKTSLTFGGFGNPNSVAVKNGLVAVAVGAATKTDAGRVYFFNAASEAPVGTVDVGALPDMVTFTPDGSKVIVANEGEPDYYGTGGTDPVGSVSIVDVATKVVTTAGFGSFTKTGLVGDGVRITGPGASAAQDLEPEYITVSADGTTAYVTLQENNAIAEVDIAGGTVTAIRALGTKDHSLAGNALDPSDRDTGINIQNWPVKGMYMPDSIASYRVGGQTYLVTANEGDGREYANPNNSADDYSDEERVKDLTLDPTAFPNAATLQQDDQLGRLTASSVAMDGSTPTTYTEILSFGARSFSIWNADTGSQVYDSGDAFEQLTGALGLLGEGGDPVFNSNNDDNDSFESRSDNKGPEPEALTIGEIDGMILAFIGLERIGGIVVYDISDPNAPSFIDYLLDRDFTVAAASAAAGDLGPEGLYFVNKADSYDGNYGLLVANEVSGTTSYYVISRVPSPLPLAMFAVGLPLILNQRRVCASNRRERR